MLRILVVATVGFAPVLLALCALVPLLGPRPRPSTVAAADTTASATEAQLAVMRANLPWTDHPVPGGARMRWCAAQDRCDAR